MSRVGRAILSAFVMLALAASSAAADDDATFVVFYEREGFEPPRAGYLLEAGELRWEVGPDRFGFVARLEITEPTTVRVRQVYGVRSQIEDTPRLFTPTPMVSATR